MDITAAQVRQLGALARLELTDAEVQQLVAQLPRIVDYVSQLQTIPTTVIVEQQRTTSTLRRDLVEPATSGAAALGQAPERDGQFWKVDAVFS